MTTKTNNNSWPPEDQTSNYPEFLKQRVDMFFNERVKNTWSGKHIMRGLVQTEHSVDVSHNDYLCIAGHPDVIEAQVENLLGQNQEKVKGSIFLHGANIHREFELAMANYLEAEDVLLCQSGWAANTGLIQSIANENVPVYIDLLAHMSLWEGIQSANAKAYPVRHNDVQYLERMIQLHGPGVVVVDSIYSINGDVCPLEEIVEISEKYGCILVVDESHSIGVFGVRGEGIVALFGLADKVHYRTASLAKAFPGRGGIIVCSSRHREYLIFESRPAIFSSCLLSHDVAGYLAMIKIICQESWRRTKLHRNAAYLRQELDKMGYNIEATKSQIISVESGTEQQTIILRDVLEKNDIFASVFCAPATPKNRAVMRMTVNADLSQTQVEHIVKVFHDIRAEVDMKNWPSTIRKPRDIAKANPLVLKAAQKLQLQTEPSHDKQKHSKVYSFKEKSKTTFTIADIV